MTNVDCFEHKDINLEIHYKDPGPVSDRVREKPHLYNPPGHTGVQGVHTALGTNPANQGSVVIMQGGKK